MYLNSVYLNCTWPLGLQKVNTGRRQSCMMFAYCTYGLPYTSYYQIYQQFSKRLMKACDLMYCYNGTMVKFWCSIYSNQIHTCNTIFHFIILNVLQLLWGSTCNVVRKKKPLNGDNNFFNSYWLLNLGISKHS